MRKKKTIAAILAAFIVLPLVFSGGLQLFQLYLKQRVSHRLEKETLTSITVPLQKVKWMEEGKEVMIEGKMFDLKTYHEKDGFLVATGVWDEEETEVMNILSNFNEGEQTGFIIRALLLIQTFAIAIYLLLPLAQGSILKRIFPFFLQQHIDVFYRKIYQPPRNLFSLS